MDTQTKVLLAIAGFTAGWAFVSILLKVSRPWTYVLVASVLAIWLVAR